jgi:hypothetical protein
MKHKKYEECSAQTATEALDISKTPQNFYEKRRSIWNRKETTTDGRTKLPAFKMATASI